MRRAAVVTTRPTMNDAQGNALIDTVRTLEDDGYYVDVHCFEYKRKEQLRVYALGGYYEHSIKSNIRALLRTGINARRLSKCDIVIAIGPDVGAIPALHLARRRNKHQKLIWEYHGLTPNNLLETRKERLMQSVRRFFYKQSMRYSDAVRVDSHYIATEIGMGKPIPLGIDVKQFSSGDASKVWQKYGINNDDFVLLYTGRLAPHKRVGMLVEAMRIIGASHPKYKLIIIGSGPLKKQLTDQASKGFGNVFFAGRVPDEEIQDYYAACDAWITASAHEGFCVPIVEAMAAGKPSIVPMEGAMPEVIGQAGVAYVCKDPHSIAFAIQYASEPGTYKVLSDSALSTRMIYDKSNVEKMFLAFIRSVVKQR